MAVARRNRTSTQTLLKGFRANSDEATRRLFEEQRPRLVRHAQASRWMSGLSSHTTAEDLVAETWVRVLASGVLERFESRGEGALHVFLLKVLTSVVTDEYRRHGRLKRCDGLRDAALEWGTPEDRDLVRTPEIFARDTSPTVRARANEVQARLEVLLEDHEWQAWRLCRIEDYSAEEAAEGLGKSAAAIRALLFRARLKILRFLYDKSLEVTSRTVISGESEVRRTDP